MVKSDPILEMRALGPACMIMGVFWLGAWAFNGFKYPALLIGAPIFILIGIAIRRYFLRWMRIEAFRNSASLPESIVVPFAREQPDLDEMALSLPAIIDLRSTWKAPIVCFLLLAFLISGLLALFIYEIAEHVPQPGLAPVLLFFLGSAVLFSACIAALLVCAGYQRIEVTEEGLNVASPILEWRQSNNQRFAIRKKNGRIGSSKTMIPWNETTLFAIVPPNRIRQRKFAPVIYELSGPKTLVRWIRMRRNMPWFHQNHKPLAPFDDYDRQMDALLSLIAAKTGLPLYDLR